MREAGCERRDPSPMIRPDSASRQRGMFGTDSDDAIPAPGWALSLDSAEAPFERLITYLLSAHIAAPPRSALRPYPYGIVEPRKRRRDRRPSIRLIAIDARDPFAALLKKPIPTSLGMSSPRQS